MAYVIKSNAALRDPGNALGNIHGYYGPPDYNAMLDFSHQLYRVGGADYEFGELCQLTRASAGSYTDIFGRQRVVGANQPRFQYLPELQVSGLLLARGLINYCEGDADGSPFTAGNASQDVCLSWEGPGSVDLDADNITLRSERKALGRTFRFYERSGAITGVTVVTGSVREVCVSNSDWVHGYIPHGEGTADDNLQIVGDALALLTDGTGSVIFRFGFLPDNGRVSFDRRFNAMAYNDQAPAGGLRIDANYRQAGTRHGVLRAHADGAGINTSVSIAQNLGNRAEVNIAGMYFENFGERAGAISHLQATSDTAANAGATPPTALTSLHISYLPDGVVSGIRTEGIILTHCIIYDRMLSDEEAQLAATFGA